MTASSSLRISGLADPRPLPVDRLLDDATVDEHGRTVVSIVDVLAAVRLRACAEVVVIELADGSSLALSLATLSGGGEQLVLLDRATCTAWLAPSDPSTPAVVVVGIRALSFASFVGGQW